MSRAYVHWPSAHAYLLTCPPGKARDQLLTLADKKCPMKLKKDRIKIPREQKAKTPQVQKKQLHAECEALCKALVFHRDCGNWESREGNCITCEKYSAALQWGHFIPRQKAPELLYSIAATAGQCAGCNGPGHGEPLLYAQAIDKRDGPGRAAVIQREFYKKPWTWSKATLTAKKTMLSLGCYEKGIDAEKVLEKLNQLRRGR